MALDIFTSPFSAPDRPKKRPRLGWDQPDPAFLARLAASHFPLGDPVFTAALDAANTSEIPSLPSCAASNTSAFPVAVPDSKASATATVSTRPTDDKDGHFNFEAGDNLTSRYKIIRKMGEGTFGRVLECWDKDEQELVAIKVVRNVEKYREDAMIEIEILCTLKKNDRAGSRGCVQFKRWFDHQNHICIVFEKLGPSLFDFLKANDYRPFSVDLVRDFGRQLLQSVAYLHGLSLIHTDLKPENVLLVSSEFSHKGEVLFQTHENLEHLAMMERVIGPIPHHLLRRASKGRVDKYFRHGRRLNWPEGAPSRESIQAVRRMPHLKDIVMEGTQHCGRLLLDLLQQLLKYDPADRPTAKEALEHPFFRNSFS